MVELIWSPCAAQDLEKICRYISTDSSHYARLFAQRINSLIEDIPYFPHAGREVPEYRRKDIRERFFQNYRIVYRIKPQLIEVVAIVHGARLLHEDWVDG